MFRPRTSLIMVCLLVLAIAGGAFAVPLRAFAQPLAPTHCAHAMDAQTPAGHDRCHIQSRCMSACQFCGGIDSLAAAVPSAEPVHAVVERPRYAGAAPARFKLAPEPPPPRLATSC